MNNWLKESDEVYYSNSKIPMISKKEINFLVNKSKLNSRKRCRVCLHNNTNEVSQEMFIVHLNECYVRPHKHIDKVESMLVIEGDADAIFFDDNGKVIMKIELSNFESGKSFFYRIPKNIFHMLIIRSEYFVFKENTLGPFNRESLIFPNWAPEIYDETFVESINTHKFL